MADGCLQYAPTSTPLMFGKLRIVSQKVTSPFPIMSSVDTRFVIGRVLEYKSDLKIRVLHLKPEIIASKNVTKLAKELT